MSEICKGLRQRLLDRAAVTDICARRIYPDALPEKAAYPCATLTKISGQSHASLTGGIGNATVRVQIDCYAMEHATDEKNKGRTGANRLAEAIRQSLHGYYGAAGDETICDCHMADEHYTFDQPRDGSDEKRYRTIQDYEIVHTEAATAF